MNKFKKLLKNCYVLIALCCLCLVSASPNETICCANETSVVNTIDSVKVIDSIKYEKTKKELIKEVDEYIDYVAPKSKLNGRTIVEACLDYNIDISFVLAQGQTESHFGTAGIAKRTNSVFNVGAYDGRSGSHIIKKGYGYSDPNESVKPYIELLLNNYLVGGKTEKDLLHNYVNKNGHRYATGRGYERDLTALYKKICKCTDIDVKYELCRKYKYSS